MLGWVGGGGRAYVCVCVRACVRVYLPAQCLVTKRAVSGIVSSIRPSIFHVIESVSTQLRPLGMWREGGGTESAKGGGGDNCFGF